VVRVMINKIRLWH